MSSASNRYCSRLRIPVPDLDGVSRAPRASLFHLLVAALLERGGPMTLDEIAQRLARVDLPPTLARGDMRSGLTKAWHGQAPVVHDTDGRLALDLLFDEWWYLLAQMKPERRWQPSKTTFVQPSEDQPLAKDEVEAALRDRGDASCSDLRRAAAVLEAAGRPLALDDINATLRELSPRAWAISDEAVAGWRSDLLVATADGTLRINPQSPQIPAFRRAIRKMAEPRLRATAEREQRSREWEQSPLLAERDQRRHQQLEEEARNTRRALLHVARGVDGILGAVLVDAQARTVRTFVSDESGSLEVGQSGSQSAMPPTDAENRLHDAAIRDLREALANYDLIAGVDVRQALRALALDPERWWLAELRPTARTHRPDKAKAIPVSLDGCVRATTKARRPLTDAPGWSTFAAASHSRDRLRERLEQDGRTLFALYEYGALHGGVRVRSRQQDTWLLRVSWSMPGDTRLYARVDAAARWWSPADIVLDAPPELGDPWARARRVDIVENYWPFLYLRDGTDVREVNAHDIFGIKVVDPRAAAAAEPGLGLGRFDRRTCQVKVTLDGIEPPIWRRVVVSASTALDRFHELLQAALGWTNSHLHAFEIENERIGIPYDLEYLDETYTRSGRIVHVGDLVDRGVWRFGYEYDFGDGWMHTIEIEAVQEHDNGDIPRCTAGARACPPEDCGGIGGYQRLLEILFEPRHEEFEDTRRWAGDFQPERFDLREINARLREVGYPAFNPGRLG